MEKLRKSLLALMVFCLGLGANAERERNNIYLFDVTASMKDYQIWDQAKNSLDRTLQSDAATSPDATTHVIAFQDNPFPSINFTAADYMAKKDKSTVRESMMNFFDQKISTPHKFTHIVDALNAGNELISPTRDNRIYLFTDGEDSRLGAKGVADTLERWCGHYPNTRLFYIMLNQAAVDSTILRVAEMCRNIHVVTPVEGVVPEYTDLGRNVIYTSTLTLDEAVPLAYSIDRAVDMRATSKDPFFRVSVVGGQSVDGVIRVKVDPVDAGIDVNELSKAIADSCDADGNYEFHARITATTPGIHVINPDVTVVVANRPLRTLELAGGTTDETELGKAGWYDSFLFWGAAEPDTVKVDLTPLFNDAAKDARSALQMRVAVPKDEPDDDFALFYDGREYSAGDAITVTPATPATLGLVFRPGAREGKRYFSLVPTTANNLERVNGMPPEELRDMGGLSFRSGYSESMNPLKIALICLGILLLAALLLWFCVLRPIRYPAIKAHNIEISGPGTYWRRVHTKGYPRVVLTSRRHKQSLPSRIFTGKTLYVNAPQWTSDILILPASRGKVKVKCPAGWSVSPGFILSRGYDYKLRSPEGETSIMKI